MHRSYQSQDTIAAIATPPGDGGVAIIRISGQQSFNITQSLIQKNIEELKSHQVHFLKLYDLEQKPLDEILLLPMHAPKTFTGEQTVEIHCHGGRLISQKILQLVCKAGAKPALPGEFTYRAFQNGKIDLTKAEAIQSLIHSQNDFALNQASKQLEGILYQKVSSIQSKLFDLGAILEAWVDFPEEGLEFCSEEEYLSDLQQLIDEAEGLCRTFHEGTKLSDSLTLCLLGAPNVGKSSLLNALCGKDRAIVTEIPGTTRDVLEEEIRIGPYSFKLHDTAGIRDTEEVIEKQGIDRAKQIAKEADLVLFVFDAGQTAPPKTMDLIQKIPPQKRIVIINKKDLTYEEAFLKELDPIWVSAKSHLGIESLKKVILETVEKKDLHQQMEIFLTNARHFHALENATSLLKRVSEMLKETVSPELILLDLKEAMRELSLIIGVDVTEELLSHIFAKFCVGK